MTHVKDLARTMRVIPLLLAAALSITLAQGSDPAAAAPVPVTSGAGLDWGLKASWRTYISPAGTTVSGGATINPDGTFHFPLRSGSYDPDTTETNLQLDGTVQFLGHCDPVAFARPCLLDLTIVDPRIELTATHATLVAQVASKPISGGAVVTYDEIELASLDVEQATPQIAGGVTTWSTVGALLTAAGSDVFTYPPNTVLDPLTFSYVGPGGKPAGETWTAPATPRYDSRALGTEQGLQTLRPGFTADQLLGVYGSGGVKLLDRATLAPIAWAMPETVPTPASVAFDPSTRTVFAGGGSGFGAIWAATWDGTAFTSAKLTDPAEWKGLVAGGGVWDAANNRYLLARYNNNTSTDAELWQVTRVGTTWTSSRIGPIVGVSGKPIATFPTALALVQDGTATAPKRLIATLRGGQPIQLYIDTAGARAVAEPLPEATGVNAAWMAQANGGIYFLGASSKAWWMPTPNVSGSVRMQTVGDALVVPGMATSADRTAVDAATNTMFVTATQGTQLARVESGQLRHVFSLPDLPLISSGAFLAGVVDGRVVTSFADSLAKGPSSYGYVDTSPSVTTQPANATVALPAGTTTATATFTPVIAGDPAPAVRWQSRLPGQPTWTDLAGQTATQLSIAVGSADAGRQFRAVLTNSAGALATAAARVDVQTPPTITLQPTATSVPEGADAILEVLPGGNPYPEIQWQLRVGGVWSSIEDATAGRLVIPDAQASLAGTEFRARLRNAVGTVYSRTVAITVVPAVSGPVAVTGGGLDWGVKESFRTYVRGMIAAGDFTTAGGAAENADGTIHFPVAGGSFDGDTGETTVRLGGSVRFSGHAGALDLTITSPRVVLDGAGGGTLYADLLSKPYPAGGDPIAYPGVAVATLDATQVDAVRGVGTVSWTGLPSVLTAVAAPAFGGFYPAGQAMDPLSLSITTGGPVVVDPDPDPGPGSGSGGGGSSTAAAAVDVAVSSAPVPTEAASVGPAPIAADAPAGRAGGPSVGAGARRVRVGRSRTVGVASVACVAGPCRVVVPKAVRVRIGGRVFAVGVVAPVTLGTGASGQVRIVLPTAALRALRGRKVGVKVRVVVLAGDERAVATVHPTIAA